MPAVVSDNIIKTFDIDIKSHIKSLSSLTKHNNLLFYSLLGLILFMVLYSGRVFMNNEDEP